MRTRLPHKKRKKLRSLTQHQPIVEGWNKKGNNFKKHKKIDSTQVKPTNL